MNNMNKTIKAILIMSAILGLIFATVMDAQQGFNLIMVLVMTLYFAGPPMIAFAFTKAGSSAPYITLAIWSAFNLLGLDRMMS